MKKISLFALIGLTSMAAASKASFDGTRTVYEENPHRIYFGTELFLFNLKTDVEQVEVEAQRVFGGISLSYEYLKPNRPYGSVELVSTTTGNGINIDYKDCSILCEAHLIGFARFSLRAGYTFGLKNGLLTPFLGAGAYGFEDQGLKYKLDESAAYVGGGIRSQYGVAPFFEIGLNLELFYVGDVEKKLKLYLNICDEGEHKWHYSSMKCKEGQHMWGGAIGLPLMWHVGAKKEMGYSV